MPECDDCGSWVSQDFARVFGCEGAVERCPECKRQRDHLPAAAHPEIEQQQTVGKRIADTGVREKNRERLSTSPDSAGTDGVELDPRAKAGDRQTDLTEWSD